MTTPRLSGIFANALDGVRVLRLFVARRAGGFVVSATVDDGGRIASASTDIPPGEFHDAATVDDVARRYAQALRHRLTLADAELQPVALGI